MQSFQSTYSLHHLQVMYVVMVGIIGTTKNELSKRTVFIVC